MREILFRGKTPTDEWVYGNLIQREECFVGVKFTKCFITKYENYIWDDVDVERETVGQYTGIKDKNGKMIFEGDIVALLNKYKRVVKYSEPETRFIINSKYEYCGGLGVYISNQIEVIGNIYDNPELLED